MKKVPAFLTAALLSTAVSGSEYTETLRTEFSEVLSVMEQEDLPGLSKEQVRPDLAVLLNRRGFLFSDTPELPEDGKKLSLQWLRKDTVFYIHPETISANVLAQLQAETKTPSGIILDLRECGGSKAAEAVRFAALFCDHTNLPQTPELPERKWNVPLTVLTSVDTVMAGEYAAMLIRKNAKALILGGTTGAQPCIRKAVPLKSGGYLLVPENGPTQQGYVPDFPADPTHTEHADPLKLRAEELLSAMECMRGQGV